MPDNITRYTEEMLAGLGVLAISAASLWTRFGGLFPARKNDIARMQKSVDRLHERFDELKGDVSDVRIKQARIEGACSALREIDRRKPPAE